MRFFKIRDTTRNVVLAARAGAATNSRERRTGLLKHSTLPEGEALWIAPCEGIHTFGMKFPIDVVYLNKRKCVVKVRERIVPRRLSMCITADSVLELPAGTVARLGVGRGDQLEFSDE